MPKIYEYIRFDKLELNKNDLYIACNYLLAQKKIKLGDYLLLLKKMFLGKNIPYQYGIPY